jgi:Putative zinc-finger
MMCRHFLLRRKYVPYLEGALSAESVKRVERHLLDCEPCRDLFVRLRAGHQMAQRLERMVPGRDTRPDFAALMTALDSPRPPFATGWQDWVEHWATPRAVMVLAAVVIVQLALLVVSNRGMLMGERSRVAVNEGTLDLGEFRQLRIDDLKSNTQPHVATDGYVYDVHRDPEEGTVAFKLGDSRSAPNQFVVCEIMTQMPPPRNGDHVRVYGVARYDAQADRKWYEVNPVLNIASLK